MKRSEIKVGEIYAYSYGKRDSEWRTPKRVRVIDLNKTLTITPTRSNNYDRSVTGIAVVRVGDDGNPIANESNEFIVAPVNLWRTWAEQIEVDKDRAEAKARQRSLDNARRAREDALIEEICTLVGPTVLVSINRDPFDGALRIQPKQLLAMIKAARTEALDEAEGFGGRYGRG